MTVAAAIKPQDCSVLTAITFHYVPSRLPYLIDVVRALNDFPVRRLDIRVLVNEISDEDLNTIRSAISHGLMRGKTLSLLITRNLPHPFNLTWAHKSVIADEFLAIGSPYTHFVYLEDDMRFGFANFAYFIEFRQQLAPFGLIPSFIRVEYSASAMEMRCADLSIIPYSWLKRITLGPFSFVNPPNPYCALYVLDRDLATEYLRSASFTLEESKTKSGFNVRERAAMGLCFENPPAEFEFRYAIPIDPLSLKVAGECWVPHLPNTYADRPNIHFGKTLVTRLVVASLKDLATARRDGYEFARSAEEHRTTAGQRLRGDHA